MKQKIKEYADAHHVEVNIKYFDPTYQIRGIPAIGADAVLCHLLAQNAVHAAMAGRTDMVIAQWGDGFTHVPIPVAVKERKKIDPNGTLWRSIRLGTWQ